MVRFTLAAPAIVSRSSNKSVLLLLFCMQWNPPMFDRLENDISLVSNLSRTEMPLAYGLYVAEASILR